MANAYNCIVVDDDEIDRLTTLSFVRKYEFLKVTGTYNNAAKAIAEIDTSAPTVLISDIDMHDINGMELRRQLKHIDACIFITSYPDYAVESFELAALDFIVKPINAARFDTAMQRLREYLELRYKSKLLDHSLSGDVIFIKDGHEHKKIKLYDVLYLEALKDYTGIITNKKKYCILSTLGNLLKSSSFSGFVRVHRSYAVQKHFITKINSKELFLSEQKIPIGRNYKTELLQLIS